MLSVIHLEIRFQMKFLSGARIANIMLQICVVIIRLNGTTENQETIVTRIGFVQTGRRVMTEKEKMEHQMLYDANYDKELELERLKCKSLCQKYNSLPVEKIDERHEFIKTIIGKTGNNIHIEPDFWCDYGYRISVGENFYANHGLVILDAGGVTFGN